MESEEACFIKQIYTNLFNENLDPAVKIVLFLR